MGMTFGSVLFNIGRCKAPAKHAVLLAFVQSLIGCVHPRRSENDEGQICVLPDQIATFAAGETLDLEVRYCISSCAEDPQASCSVHVDGNNIYIQSEASWDETEELCILICKSLVATCAVMGLDPGTYVVEHGEVMYDLKLPSEDTPVCLQPRDY